MVTLPRKSAADLRAVDYIWPRASAHALSVASRWPFYLSTTTWTGTADLRASSSSSSSSHRHRSSHCRHSSHRRCSSRRRRSSHRRRSSQLQKHPALASVQQQQLLSDIARKSIRCRPGVAAPCSMPCGRSGDLHLKSHHNTALQPRAAGVVCLRQSCHNWRR